ncbi:MAG: hypothetical protein IT545_00195 [Rhodobacteraceae bacterium]|nr:hypothetical protein [Paracoccaceae bacterium]
MIEFLLTVHFLALAVGLGGGVAAGVIGARLAAAAPSARAELGAAQKRIGLSGAIALALVWASGLALLWSAFGGFGGLGGLGLVFWLKMAAVVVLTAAVVAMKVVTGRSERAGAEPDTPTMARLGMVATGATTLAVILAVLAFAP